MKRIVIWLLSTVTVVVLLFGYRTSTQGALTGSGDSVVSSGTDPGTSSSTGSDSGTDSTTSTGDSTGSSSGSGSSSSSGSSKTVTGSTVQTRWGPVQVQITVKSGKITKVNVLQYPNSNHKDVEINSQALPILVDETISAQSADIDMVGGATITSEGYIQSLQSALDQAGL